nr:acyl-CoA/acyl-ACP dehydrogenase [Sphingorhabdus sp.]
MLFEIPQDIRDYLAVLDEFIEREIKPMEQRDDNIRFFDHRRENARTDWDNGGLPTHDWEALLSEMRRAADAAGHYRYALPSEYGGQDGSNLGMAVIRHHLAHKGLGLHNDLQNESSIVGNLVQPLMVRDFGTEQQRRDYIPAMLNGDMRWSFGLTEEAHGSDATWMETRAEPAVRGGIDGWLINGEKMWTTGSHVATHCMV